MTITKNKMLLLIAALPMLASAQEFAPAAPSSTKAANFDVLRGNAYAAGAFGNMASSFTVGDYLAWPHLMGGQKFLYVEPTAESGTVAVPFSGKTAFLNLQNGTGGALGVTTIGLAATDSWGASLSVGKDKVITSTDPINANNNTTETVTAEGDVIGANVSMKTGGNAVSLSAKWETAQDETGTTQENGNYQQDNFYSLIVAANYSNFPSAQGLVWNAGVTFDRYNLSHEVKAANTTTLTLDPDCRTQVRVAFNMGQKVLSNSKSRVLLGLDNTLVLTTADEITNTRTSAYAVDLLVAPNLVGEYSFTEKWMAFGGARHSIEPIGLAASTNGPAAAKTDVTALTFLTSTTTATIGTRFTYESFAAEAALSDALFSNGPSVLFTDAHDLLITFGAFLNF
jgi:hypothetical protein